MVLKRFISFVLVIYLGCFVFGDNAPQDTKNYNSRCKPKVSQLKYKVSMQEAKDLHHNEEISVKNHSNSKKCKDKKLKDFPTKKITKTLSFKASVVNSASMSYPTLKSNIKPAYFQEEVSVSKHSYPTSQTKELKDKNYNSVSKNSKKTSATSSVMSYPTSKSKYNEFYQKVSLTKYSSPTSETKEQKKNNNNSVLTPEKEGEKGNKKTTTKVLPVSTSTPTLQPKVLFSGQGTGTYYYDSNDKVCPGSSYSTYPENQGITTCESFTAGKNQVTLGTRNNNRILAIDIRMLQGEGRLKYCGKKVLVYYKNKLQPGDFYVWDGCAACAKTPRLDFSLSSLQKIAGNAYTCHIGVVPDISWKIIDEQIFPFYP